MASDKSLLDRMVLHPELVLTNPEALAHHDPTIFAGSPMRALKNENHLHRDFRQGTAPYFPSVSKNIGGHNLLRGRCRSGTVLCVAERYLHVFPVAFEIRKAW